MYKYLTDFILAVDVVLLTFSLLVSVCIITYSVTEEYFYKKRVRLLLQIKNHLYELSVSGKRECTDAVLLRKIAPTQFLDVVTNRYREAIFFNSSEQGLFKDCFINEKNISRLEALAKGAGNKWRRIEAILCLAHARIESSVDIFRNTIFDMDGDVSYYSIIALGRIKTLPSAEILIEFLKRKNLYRYKIVSTLATFPSVIAHDLSSLLKENDPQLRSSALKLLGRFKASDYHGEVEKVSLGDSSDEVRADACECLGDIGSPASRETLLNCLKDEFWQVRSNAVEALSKIFGGGCIPEVIGMMNDGSLSVIGSVKNVMSRNIKESLPYIEKILQSKDTMAKKLCVEALDESGYMVELYKNVLSGNGIEDAMRLLDLIIKSGSHFGLEAAFTAFDEQSRYNILKAIGSLNAQLAEHIEKKLTHQISEFME